MKAVVTHKSHTKDGVVYEVGDELDVTDRELDAFGDRLQVVERPKKQAKKQGGADGSSDADAG